MPRLDLSSFFSIGGLVERTGVNASTLRAWENRHALITPKRAPSGHRLYGADDVVRVHRVQALLAQGLSLPRIAARLREEARPPRTEEGGWAALKRDSLTALEDFSSDELDRLYGEACAVHPFDEVADRLLIPVLETLGDRWDKRSSGIAEEHFYSAWLRNKLGARLHHARNGVRGRNLVLACLPEENHEIGLLIFALGLMQSGYRAIYLGANMPARQIVHVTRRTNALGIVLSGRTVRHPPPLLADIAWLRSESGLPVYVGSHVSDQLEEDFRLIGVEPLGCDIRAGVRQLDADLTRSRSRAIQV